MPVIGGALVLDDEDNKAGKTVEGAVLASRAFLLVGEGTDKRAKFAEWVGGARSLLMMVGRLVVVVVVGVARFNATSVGDVNIVIRKSVPPFKVLWVRGRDINDGIDYIGKGGMVW